ncbi:hypothetical protein [Actinocorallia libanotica]|uniref:DUF2567 domain-containing protein n=1 Tax=Actinocorallia libanotica TaxID=46162 RepID=A0ABN1RZR0_9ACTN
MRRHVRVWGVATGVLALLGLPAGLLWSRLADRPEYVVVGGRAYPADSESEVFIGADGKLALICVALGLVAGAVAYWRAGRAGEVPLVLGLCAGGLLGSLLAWWVGHRFGLTGFEQAVRGAADGTRVTGPLDLGATAVVTLQPLVSVIVFGMLEALDAAGRLRPAYHGGTGAGEPQQVGRGEFDLQPAPPGGDVDRREV